MTNTLCILALSMAAAQAPRQDYSVVPPQTSHPSALQHQQKSNTQAAPKSPGLFGKPLLAGNFRLFPRLRERVTNWFKPSRPQPNNQIRTWTTNSNRKHTSFRIAPAPVKKAPGQSIEPPLGPGRNNVNSGQKLIVAGQLGLNLPLSKHLDGKVGHGAKYSWITGQLFRHPKNARLWVVRYAGDNVVDPYGGHVVLSTSKNMSGFRPGEVVCVQGQVRNDRNALRRLGAPIYQTTDVLKVDVNR